MTLGHAHGPEVLLARLHGHLLRELAARTGIHFQGLHQAAAYCWKRQLISSQTAKRLRHLDTAYNYVRHISEVKIQSFADDVISQISLRQQDAKCDINQHEQVEQITEVAKGQEEEELEDVPEDEKDNDPLMNLAMSKNGLKGVVEEIERGTISKERLYRVRYEDMDLEHFTREQVLACRAADPAL